MFRVELGLTSCSVPVHVCVWARARGAQRSICARTHTHISEGAGPNTESLKLLNTENQSRFLGSGSDEALFSEKKGFSVKRGE